MLGVCKNISRVKVPRYPPGRLPYWAIYDLVKSMTSLTYLEIKSATPASGSLGGRILRSSLRGSVVFGSLARSNMRFSKAAEANPPGWLASDSAAALAVALVSRGPTYGIGSGLASGSLDRPCGRCRTDSTAACSMARARASACACSSALRAIFSAALWASFNLVCAASSDSFCSNACWYWVGSASTNGGWSAAVGLCPGAERSGCSPSEAANIAAST